MDERFSAQHHVKFHTLLAYLSRVPAVSTNTTPWAGFGTGENGDGRWWVKFSLKLSHPLAWHVVQEFAFVLNGVSLNEALPTVFKPVSPPPYLNGGPEDYLSWVIECNDHDCRPGTLAKWLEEKLPRPVEALDQWPTRGQSD